MKKIIMLTLFVISFISCEKNNNDFLNQDGKNSLKLTEPVCIYKIENNCDQLTLISKEKYKTALQDHLTINKLEIIDECLKINFGSSGCSGDTWKLELIDSEQILYSYPPQRNLILSFENKEECEAYITKDISFKITNLKINDKKIRLNIKNGDSIKSILFEY